MTAITETGAYEAMLEHHKRLGEELAIRADAVSGAVAAGRPYGAAAASLIAYLTEEVLPHAAAKENDVVLPALLADQSVDLTALLERMHGAMGEQAHNHAPAQPAASQAEDPEATVVELLLQAVAALARAGEADRACKIAASAWAALRDGRPDLAGKVTAVLHGLARRVGA